MRSDFVFEFTFSYSTKSRTGAQLETIHGNIPELSILSLSDSYFELNIGNTWGLSESEMSVPMGQDTSHRSSTPLPTTPFPYEEGNHSPRFKPSNLFHLEENLSKTFPENSALASTPLYGCLQIQMDIDREALERARELEELRAGSITFETSQDERNPKWDSPESESPVLRVPHPSILMAMAIHQQFYEIYR